ncbi:gliding motility-associated C-terminal domain-containing protein [Pollutibacter soli]|uniref:T9SS type B sorting domain-containing protein n=1 Tax=Pollutibacter soli TaxID=3034157 RepID=UPI003013B68C
MKYPLFWIFVFLFLFQINGICQVNLNNGLVARYAFDGNSNDVSGNNHHGVIHNGIVPGIDRYGAQGKSYYFDGVDDYISVDDTDGDFSTPQMSISIWFKANDTRLQNLVGKRNFTAAPPSGQQFQFFINYPPAPGIGSNIISSLNGCGDITIMSYTNTGEPICAQKWYNAVIVFDGQFHKIYINGVLKKSVASSFNSMALCNSELRFGNWWEGDLIPFKGYMDDVRWYNRPLTNDEIVELYKDRPADISSSTNFYFEQQICDPNSFQFTINQSFYNNFRWHFGDGSPVSTIRNPIHKYPGNGSYEVLLVAGSGACTDTVRKLLYIDYLKTAVISPRDTVICLGQEVTLKSDSATQYCWNGTVQTRELTIKPSQKTSYVVTVRKDGPNLIPNGNFSSGNTGYTSDYFYNSPNAGTGEIFIGTNPQAWNTAFCSNCGDHTNGTGNLLMVNAPLAQDSRVWYRNATVFKNTNYSFSFWIYTNSSGNQPAVGVKINNQIIGSYSTVAGNNDKWTRVSFNWNSESVTAAAISIFSTNLSTSTGNDFGLDDISFNTTTLIRDSVTVDVKNKIGALVANPDTAICPGASLQLNVTGSEKIRWSPSTDISDATSLSPILFPTKTTTYVVSNIDNSICPASDTVVVTLKTKPAVIVTNDTLYCVGKPGFAGIQMSSGGGASYHWFPATGLSNVNIANPIANPTATTVYRVSVTGSNGCIDTGDVQITVSAFANVKASADAILCSGKSANLAATGGTDYHWTPALGLSSNSIANPVATPSQTTSYIVNSPSAGACSGKDTVVVTVNANPVINLSPGDTMICSGTTVQLSASGGSQYTWLPATGLSSSSISNPRASPAIKTTYAVEVTDINGCKSSGSVTIDVKQTVAIKASADLTTCYGKSVNISASGASDYAWSPSTGLSSSGIANPIANPAVTTSYVVTSPSAGVCSGKDTVIVVVNPLPKLNVSPSESLVCAGGSVQLSAAGAESYTWSPASGLTNASIANPVAKPQFTTNYTVKGISPDGCVDSLSAKVIVGPAGKIFVPNAFTPNGDGLNDCFSVKSAAGATSFELAIYNRWGERVFHSKDPLKCWDGTYKGNVQPNGNFAYYLKVISDCGNINEKGLITLIK